VSVALDHTIVPARDKRASADFLAAILGVTPGEDVGRFAPVLLANGVTLDFMDVERFEPHHYAFVVDDAEFDPIFERIQAADTTFYADPGRARPGRINRRFGGRGVYFDDPDGHLLEVLTRPDGPDPRAG
jgi:catechol 2,3-dioxygenase-like lactoylglutathione lyase family enzyme